MEIYQEGENSYYTYKREIKQLTKWIKWRSIPHFQNSKMQKIEFDPYEKMTSQNAREAQVYIYQILGCYHFGCRKHSNWRAKWSYNAFKERKAQGSKRTKQPEILDDSKSSLDTLFLKSKDKPTLLEGFKDGHWTCGFKYVVTVVETTVNWKNEICSWGKQLRSLTTHRSQFPWKMITRST